MGTGIDFLWDRMKRFVLIAVLLAVVLFGAAIARGEISENEGLLVSFNGGFAPRSLPRDRDVPVTVNLHVGIKTADGARPPQLRRISLEVNRYGRLSTKGLPVCHPALLESTDPQTALARCRPNRAPFPVNGRMLAFNGRAHGRPAILLHIHGSSPADVTVVLVFAIQHPARGKFGTVLTTKIPRLASDLGYVSDVALEFNREYRYRGRQYSFLSARCAAPSGFPGAIFSFTRGTFSFAGGKQIHTTLTRDCVVR
jgi:hypothetical protein